MSAICFVCVLFFVFSLSCSFSLISWEFLSSSFRLDLGSGSAFVPAASFSEGQGVSFNFGGDPHTPLRHLPEGYAPAALALWPRPETPVHGGSNAKEAPSELLPHRSDARLAAMRAVLPAVPQSTVERALAHAQIRLAAVNSVVRVATRREEAARAASVEACAELARHLGTSAADTCTEEGGGDSRASQVQGSAIAAPMVRSESARATAAFTAVVAHVERTRGVALANAHALLAARSALARTAPTPSARPLVAVELPRSVARALAGSVTPEGAAEKESSATATSVAAAAAAKAARATARNAALAAHPGGIEAHDAALRALLAEIAAKAGGADANGRGGGGSSPRHSALVAAATLASVPTSAAELSRALAAKARLRAHLKAMCREIPLRRTLAAALTRSQHRALIAVGAAAARGAASDGGVDGDAAAAERLRAAVHGDALVQALARELGDTRAATARASHALLFAREAFAIVAQLVARARGGGVVAATPAPRGALAPSTPSTRQRAATARWASPQKGGGANIGHMIDFASVEQPRAAESDAPSTATAHSADPSVQIEAAAAAAAAATVTARGAHADAVTRLRSDAASARLTGSGRHRPGATLRREAVGERAVASTLELVSLSALPLHSMRILLTFHANPAHTSRCLRRSRVSSLRRSASRSACARASRKQSARWS